MTDRITVLTVLLCVLVGLASSCPTPKRAQRVEFAP